MCRPQRRRNPIEYRVRGIGDGVERWVATRGQTYFENGTATDFFGVALDISEQKEREAELQHLNETLEQRVAQRAAEAEEANRKLRAEIAEHARAETRLQELRSELSHAARLSAVGQMAGAFAHEINQPLGATINFANAARRLLASGDPRRIDAARRIMEDAAAQVLRAGQIIRRVRDFVGQGETDKRLEDVVQMIEEASALALVGPDALEVVTPLQLRSKRLAGLRRSGADPAGPRQFAAECARGDEREPAPRTRCNDGIARPRNR